MHRLSRLVSIAAIVGPAVAASSSRAHAEGEATAPPASSAPAPVVVAPPPLHAPAAPSPSPSPSPAPIAIAPAAAPASQPSRDEGPQTAHDLVLGRWGFGYFGQFDAPLGFTGARTAGGTTPIQLVGVRSWLGRARLDLAIGTNYQAGSNDVSGASSDQPKLFAWAARVAVPIALWTERYYTVFAGPELAYAHASENDPATDVDPTTGAPPRAASKHRGHRVSLGARAGAEIHFGFVGLPRLALDATMGVSLDFTGGSSDGFQTTSYYPAGNWSYTHVGWQTFTSHQPWNIFVSNVAAVYYF